MKTRIYIDGYNLYYGCLKHTHFKWLNLVVLFEKHLFARSGTPHAYLDECKGIKYFTADINDKVAHDENSLKDQLNYHAGLQNYCGQKLDIIKGNYSVDQANYPHVDFSENGQELAPRDCHKVRVWKLEEKQSDVNIAVESLFDVMSDETIEQVIFVTNDTDLVPVLKKIRIFNEHSIRKNTVKVGLVIPARRKDVEQLGRKANKSLSQCADWTISFIDDSELEKSSLPNRISNGKKPQYRPAGWFEYSEIVALILTTLMQAKDISSLPKAWRWLSTKKPSPDDLTVLPSAPDQLMDDEYWLNVILEHAKAYVAFKNNI